MQKCEVDYANDPFSAVDGYEITIVSTYSNAHYHFVINVMYTCTLYVAADTQFAYLAKRTHALWTMLWTQPTQMVRGAISSDL